MSHQHRPMSRNAECPCGSGRKVKRCHPEFSLTARQVAERMADTMLVITEEEKLAAARQRVKQAFNNLVTQGQALLRSLQDAPEGQPSPRIADVPLEKVREMLGPDYDVIVSRLQAFTAPFGSSADSEAKKPAKQG